MQLYSSELTSNLRPLKDSHVILVPSFCKMHCWIIFLLVKCICLGQAWSSVHVQNQQMSQGKQNSRPSSIHLKAVLFSLNCRSSRPYCLQTPLIPLKIWFCNLSGFTICCNSSITLPQTTVSYLEMFLLSFWTNM